MSKEKPCVCIVVENLPVPLDRLVWQESCALRDAGHEVVVICPRMRGFTEPELEAIFWGNMARAYARATGEGTRAHQLEGPVAV